MLSFWGSFSGVCFSLGVGFLVSVFLLGVVFLGSGFFFWEFGFCCFSPLVGACFLSLFLHEAKHGIISDDRDEQ